MDAYSDIESHRGMAFDEARNRAYLSALEQAVEPGCTVLDLGAGLGVHGLMAARLGATRVYLVDPSPVVLHATQLADINGVADRVQVIRGRIEEIDLPVRVDIIVSVLTGNFLLEEDLLPSLFVARDRFLAPGGVMLPDRARMQVALASAAGFHAKHIASWSRPTLGLDFSAMRKFAANAVYFRSATAIAADLMSEPGQLLELDFVSADRAGCRARVELKCLRAGSCHGLLGWFDMRLGREWSSTGPNAKVMHWSPAFLPVDPPLELESGEVVELEVDRPEYGEWTWTLTHNGARHRYSTFQSALVDPGHLKRRSPDYSPGLGRDGKVALFVLAQMAAGKTLAEVTVAAREHFPDLARRDRRWEARIRDLAACWGREAS